MRNYVIALYIRLSVEDFKTESLSINKVYVFPGDRIEIEYATQDFLETKESEKEV